MKIKIILKNDIEYKSINIFNHSLNQCENCKNNDVGVNTKCKLPEDKCNWNFVGIKNIKIETLEEG